MTNEYLKLRLEEIGCTYAAAGAAIDESADKGKNYRNTFATKINNSPQNKGTSHAHFNYGEIIRLADLLSPDKDDQEEKVSLFLIYSSEVLLPFSKDKITYQGMLNALAKYTCTTLDEVAAGLGIRKSEVVKLYAGSLYPIFLSKEDIINIFGISGYDENAIELAGKIESAYPAALAEYNRIQEQNSLGLLASTRLKGGPISYFRAELVYALEACNPPIDAAILQEECGMTQSPAYYWAKEVPGHEKIMPSSSDFEKIRLTLQKYNCPQEVLSRLETAYGVPTQLHKLHSDILHITAQLFRHHPLNHFRATLLYAMSSCTPEVEVKDIEHACGVCHAKASFWVKEIRNQESAFPTSDDYQKIKELLQQRHCPPDVIAELDSAYKIADAFKHLPLKDRKVILQGTPGGERNALLEAIGISSL